MTVIGEISLIAKIDTSQYKQGAKEVEQANKDIEKSANEADKKSSKSFANMKAGMLTLIPVTVAVAAAIVKNLGGAIRRIDTLENSQRVFENLGFAAGDVEDSMKGLVDTLTGLPTALPDAVIGVQQLAASTQDIRAGTQIFEALNNAVLGLGGTTHQVEGAVLAMSRAIDRGKLQGQEWQMLLTSRLGPALQNIAREMGMTAGELREGLSDGTISLQNFVGELLKANREGAGSMASFEQQAIDATSGIGTSYTNMNIAIQKGLAGIMDAIGTETIANALNNIGRGFEVVFGLISSGIGFVRSNASFMIPIIAGLGAGITAFLAASTAAFIFSKTIAIATVVIKAMSGPLGWIILAISTLTALLGGFAVARGMENIKEGLDESADSARETAGGVGDIGDNLGQAASGAKNLAKELAKIDRQITKTNRDFREQLAELVSNKRQSIAELTSQLEEERVKYNKAYSDRLHDFTQTQQEESDRHQDKTKSLQTQIDFLSRYNNQANQRRLSELRFALARENHEFEKRNQERVDKYDQDAEHERLSYEKRQKELQSRLDSESALLNKHRKDVDAIRNVMLLDEIQKLKRSRDEQLANLNTQKKDAISSAAATTSGIAGQWSSPSFLKDLSKSGKDAGKAFSDSMKKEIGNMLSNIFSVFKESAKEWQGIFSGRTKIEGLPGFLQTPQYWIRRMGGFSTGGFTGRGSNSEPAGIVHRGEYVLPQSLVNQTTGLPDLDKLMASMDNSQSQPVVVSLKHSKGAMRQAALDTISLVNEVYKSRGQAPIGVQN